MVLNPGLARCGVVRCAVWLVFQGDSIAGAVLTRRSCDGDYSRNGA
jgi:hypothetical protein